MEITREMIDELAFEDEKIVYELVARYMEYVKTPKPFVMQSHEIGKSQHLDWRMKVNDYLIGWSIVGGNIENPITPQRLIEQSPKQFRGETKARQPLMWLKVEGEIKPGEVGAAIEKPGKFTILAKGKFMTGAQKVWYHEYFLKGGAFKDWTRIEVRAVKVPALDPETKKKIPGRFERVWMVRIPENQVPYALERGIQKKWKPPKNYIPFPEEYIKKKYPEKYKKWLEYMKKEEASLSTIRFTLALASWMGPRAKVGRRMPKFRWYLLLDEKGKGSVRTFFLDGYPIKETMMPAYEEARTNRKWLDYSGDTRPNTRFNPNKELVGKYEIIDKGRVSYSSIYENKKEIITLVFKGKILKGKYTLTQEEEEADFYAFEKLSELSEEEELEEYPFVLHKHTVKDKFHYDLRWKIANDKKNEFNLDSNTIDIKAEEPIKAIDKEKTESPEQVKYWMVKEGKNIKRMIGKLETYVDVLDYGTLEPIEINPKFMSFNIKGKKLKGIYIARKSNNIWIFTKSAKVGQRKLLSQFEKIYEILQQGDPRKGIPFSPFQIEEKRGWNYFRIYLYDLRKFTRCESQEKVKKYLPNLIIPEGVETIGICLYSIPGKLHRARVAYIRFNKDKFTYAQAKDFIRENKLHLFDREMIREKRK